MKVGFVCTNYNNSSYTRSAIVSLHNSTRPDDVRIVVVDNNSGAEDVHALEQIASEYPHVELALCPQNLGYFPGLNVGIRQLRRTFADIQHIVVGNNDLEFPPDFVETLQAHRDVFRSWAVVSPDLITPDGTHQNPHVLRPISRLRQLAWEVYFLSYSAAVLIKWAARITKRFTVRPENSHHGMLHKSAGPIEQGYGACYLLGPIFFEHFSGLCAPTFLMQEEFFLYEQLKCIGQMTYYDPRFLVHHHGHASTERLPSRRHWKLSRKAHSVYKRYLAMPPTEKRDFIVTAVRSPSNND